MDAARHEASGVLGSEASHNGNRPRFGSELRTLERELKVAAGWSKERERGQVGIKLWSLEEERRGEREEKKNLKEKRVEDESGGKERRIFAADVIAVRYGDGSWRL